MLRAIRGLAVVGLVAVGLAAWVVFAPPGVPPSPYAIARHLPNWAYLPVMRLPQFVIATSTLLSFSAGVLTVALTLPRRQRLWSVALLASLILNAYWTLAFPVVWTFFPQAYDLTSPSPLFFAVINVISFGLAPTAPALVALAYTVRSARSSPQAAHAAEEDGSLDISTEPLGNDEP
ncbi:MAG: hypothetical protein ACXVA4_12420 [Ktedonobacterales bacterium]